MIRVYVTYGDTIERCGPHHEGPYFEMEEREYLEYLDHLEKRQEWDDFIHRSRKEQK
jgi:hypothetical protein